MHLRPLLVPAALLLLCASAAASAEDLAPGRAMLRSSASTEKDLGIGIGFGPSWIGGGKRQWMGGVVLEDNFGNGVFVSGQDGLGYRFLETPSGFSMAASIGVSMGRDESDGKNGSRNRLRGMGDVSAKAQANLFLNYDSGPFHVNAGLHQTLASRRGTSADLSVAYDLLSSRDDLVRAEAGIAYGNRNFMQTYFGVTADQSKRSGNAVYTARAGIAGEGMELTWRHAFGEKWVGTLGAGVIRLGNEAANSPLTERRTQAAGAVTIAYRF